MINIPAVVIDRIKEDRARSAYEELEEEYHEQEATIERLTSLLDAQSKNDLWTIEALKATNSRLRGLLSAFVYNRTPEGYIRLCIKAVELMEEE